MKIEDLFKEKMNNASVEAPSNLWNKIQNNLNQAPQNTNIDTNSQNIITNASSAISTTLTKVVVTTIGVVATSIGGYLIYDNLSENENTPTPITLTKTEKPLKNETTIDTTTLIATQPSHTTTQKIAEPIITIENTPIDTITTIIETPQPKHEAIIAPTPQTKPEPTPTQSQIAENKPTEENIVKEEQPVQTKIEEFNPNIRRPNFISPNNDGINDVFKIDNLEAYPDNEIVIFDKNGRIVFQAAPYNNDWDAANIQQGTYFYKLLIKEGQNKKIFKGSITIML
jgi:gliding motility-associated-like protein